MSDKKVAQELVECLRDIGVRHVFGVPSGGWVDYMEALRTTEGIEFVLATHEGAAGMMADVCGRITGVPGVCFGTFGPGATNLTTGVGEALLDRSPMIALTDEMTEDMRDRVVQMGIDHQALFAPITKKTTRLEAGAVRDILCDAAELAVSGRPGPVHVGLPVGMSTQESTPSDRKPAGRAPDPVADESAMKAACDLIRKSEKPVIAIGLGAVEAKVREPILKLAEVLDVPVVITPMAKGMIAEDHRSYAGVLFHALSDLVGETHKQADLVIAFGYDPVEFNFEAWMPSVPLINADIEPADINKVAYPDVVDVTGDIAVTLDGLLKQDFGVKDWDMDALALRRADLFRRMVPKGDVFGPNDVLEILRDVLPQEGIMTCDVGAHTHLIGQQWPTPAPGKQFMTNGWSTMGFGLPAAIAAKLCVPEVPVCAVVGDGGFLMTVGELATVVRYNIPLVVVVLTDNDLALIRIKQEKKGNPIYGTPVRATGTIGGDNLFGVPVRSVTNREDLRRELEVAFAAKKPVIVEAIVNSRVYDDLVLKKDKN